MVDINGLRKVGENAGFKNPRRFIFFPPKKYPEIRAQKAIFPQI